MSFSAHFQKMLFQKALMPNGQSAEQLSPNHTDKPILGCPPAAFLECANSLWQSGCYKVADALSDLICGIREDQFKLSS